MGIMFHFSSVSIVHAVLFSQFCKLINRGIMDIVISSNLHLVLLCMRLVLVNFSDISWLLAAFLVPGAPVQSETE
jgi:hypothetical protein